MQIQRMQKYPKLNNGWIKENVKMRLNEILLKSVMWDHAETLLNAVMSMVSLLKHKTTAEEKLTQYD